MSAKRPGDLLISKKAKKKKQKEEALQTVGDDVDSGAVASDVSQPVPNLMIRESCINRTCSSRFSPNRKFCHPRLVLYIP